MPINILQAIGVTKLIRDKGRKMSLSVSYKQNLNSGIDSAALKEVAKQIFQRANSKTSELSNLDLTKFNRATLGTDLYSGKVDVSTARQIAITNSGMQVNLNDKALNSLKYLNSEASKAIFKNVEGKIAAVETKETTEKTKIAALPSFGQLIEVADLGSDKKGSNPFYKGELLNTTKTEEKEEALNMLA